MEHLWCCDTLETQNDPTEDGHPMIEALPIAKGKTYSSEAEADEKICVGHTVPQLLSPDMRKEAPEIQSMSIVMQAAERFQASTDRLHASSSGLLKEHSSVTPESPTPASSSRSVGLSVRSARAGKHSVASGPELIRSGSESWDRVIAFGRRASVGIPCVFLQDDSGARRRAFIVLDEKFENLAVMPNSQGGLPLASVSLRGISEIYANRDDGSSMFPCRVLRRLRRGEEALLLMLLKTDDAVARSRICLLLESEDDLDSFLESMRVLCISAHMT